MKQPLISVVIAAYNAEPWLAETLESVIAQTWSKVEIIVVDDGSQDGTLAVAKRYESPQIKVIHQENQGQCAASNRCLQAAQGDFIQYLDADDLLAPDKIEQQIQRLLHNPPGYIASGAWARFYHSIQAANFKVEALWTDFSPVDWLLCAWQNHLMMHGAAWLLPRDIVEKAGPWDTRLSLINDFDYFSRIILASKGILFCEGARTYYRSGLESSLSGQTSTAAWQSAFLALCKGTSNLLAKEDSPLAKQVCANVFQRFIYETYPAVPELRAAAALNVKQLGGATIQAQGSPWYNKVSKVFGWKQANHLRNYFRKQQQLFARI